MAAGYPDAVYGGIIAIYTPCAGVIVPAFLAHLGGAAAIAGRQGRRWFNAPLLLGSLSFVLGFTLVFVLLGTVSGASDWVRGHQGVISKAGGMIVMLFGLLATGILPLPQLAGAPRARPTLAGVRYLASVMVGVAFAIGWTPCVNRQLGEVLTLSHDPSTAGEGARLLTAYSIAFMLPFLAIGVALAAAAPRVSAVAAEHASLRRPSSVAGKGLAVVAGAVLMVLGALVFTDRFVELTGYLYRLG